MQPIRLALLALLAVAFSACTKSPSMIDRTYVGRDYSQSSVAVLAVDPQGFQILNPDDFDDDFHDQAAFVSWRRVAESGHAGALPERHRELFLGDELAVRVVDRASRRWNNLRVFAVPRAREFVDPALERQISQAVGEELITVRLPTPRALGERGIKSQFVLAFDQIVFERRLQKNGKVVDAKTEDPTGFLPVDSCNPTFGRSDPTCVGHTNGPADMGYSLHAKLSYVLYDVTAQKVVSAGRAEADRRFVFAMTTGDWYKVMDKLFAQVKAPF